MGSFKSRYGQIFFSVAFVFCVFLSVSGFGVFGATPSGESGSQSNDSPTSGVYSFHHLVEDCVGCGSDYYSCTQGAAHVIIHNVYAPASMKCGHLYRLCASEDHGLKQATCLTDPDCIATNFWLCQHTTHQYASDLSPGTEAPTAPTTLTCRNFHTYSTRDASVVAYHAEVKTCTRCGVSYVACDALDPAKSGCSSGYVWHTTEAPPDPYEALRHNYTYVFRYNSPEGVPTTLRDETAYTPGEPRPEVVIDVLNTSDADLERLSGWDFRINPITMQPFQEPRP